jgi:hypothetical protein
MIKAKNEKQIMEALISPQGQIIANFLIECHSEKTIECVTQSEIEQIYRAQGAAGELNEILELASNARKVLNS